MRVAIPLSFTISGIKLPKLPRRFWYIFYQVVYWSIILSSVLLSYMLARYEDKFVIVSEYKSVIDFIVLAVLTVHIFAITQSGLGAFDFTKLADCVQVAAFSFVAPYRCLDDVYDFSVWSVITFVCYFPVLIMQTVMFYQLLKSAKETQTLLPKLWVKCFTVTAILSVGLLIQLLTF